MGVTDIVSKDVPDIVSKNFYMLKMQILHFEVSKLSFVRYESIAFRLGLEFFLPFFKALFLLLTVESMHI